MVQSRKIAPCLWFDGKALEAAEFYVSVFGGAIDKVHHAPLDTPGARRGDVLFVEFNLAGEAYQALNGGPHHAFNEAISLSVACADQAEVDRLWSALIADGGKPVACGWLKDKYGVSWQIVPTRMLELLGDADPARAKRAFEAMLGMVKMDIATLEAAVSGT